MKIMKIILENFRSFQGEHTIVLSDLGLTFVEGINHDAPRMKSNASGKSSILDGIDWGLFGKDPRNDKAGAVVNDKVGKDCRTHIFLRDGDDSLIVERYRKHSKYSGKSGLKVTWNGEDKTKLDTDATQEILEKYLGLNRKVFHAAVMFGQTDTFEFADATDSQRKEILTEILDLGHLDQWAKAASDAHKNLEKQIEEDGATYNRVFGEWQALSQTDPFYNVATWEQERQARIQDLESRLRQAHVDLEVAKSHLSPEVAMGSPLPPPDRSTLHRQAQESMRVMDTELHRIESHIAIAEGRPCPTCGQFVEGKGDLVALQAQREKYQGQRTYAAQTLDVEEGQYQQRLRQVLETNARIEAARRHQSSMQKNVDLAQGFVHRANDDLKREHNAVNPFTQQAHEHQQRLHKLRADLDTRRQNLETQTERLRYYDFWKVGLGAKGMKSFVLDSRLAEMTAEANKWVALLTGNTHWIRFESQKEVGSGKSKRLVDDFNIRVFHYNTDGTTSEQSYRSHSGGEKARVGLGIDFGLASLVAKRATKAWDILFLDEKFRQSIDGAGKEALAELLEAIAEDKSTIMVIDHDRIFQGIFEKTIRVEKKDGCSQVFVDGNEEK